MNNISKIGILILACSCLSACGQTGPLYMPGTKSPYGPPYYSPTHPVAEPSDKEPAKAAKGAA